MADPLEWYAADNLGLSACYEPTPVLESPFPNKAIYGRIVGSPAGVVVWTPVWEPLASGGSPDTYSGGPLAAGQTPTEEGFGSPNTYVPSDSNAVAVVGFYELGILRLSATLDGSPIAGELVMTISASSSDYPDLALAYQDGDPGTETFWTAHQNTYEIP